MKTLSTLAAGLFGALVCVTVSAGSASAGPVGLSSRDDLRLTAPVTEAHYCRRHWRYGHRMWGRWGYADYPYYMTDRYPYGYTWGPVGAVVGAGAGVVDAGLFGLLGL